MRWVARFPGMKAGHRLRNTVVGIGYVFVVLPIVVVLFPLLAVWAVESNYRNVAGRLSGLPGIDSGGGVQTGFAAGLYALALWGVILWSGMLYVDLGAESEPNGAESESNGAESDPAATIDETGPADESIDEDISEAELLVLFETIASQWGVEVISTEMVDDTFTVEYYVGGETEEEVTSEIGTLIGAYIDIVEGGLESDRMDVTAVDEDDDSDEAYWHVESDWAEAYLAGELSEEDVLDRVLPTVESA